MAWDDKALLKTKPGLSFTQKFVAVQELQCSVISSTYERLHGCFMFAADCKDFCPDESIITSVRRHDKRDGKHARGMHVCVYVQWEHVILSHYQGRPNTHTNTFSASIYHLYNTLRCHCLSAICLQTFTIWTFLGVLLALHSAYDSRFLHNLRYPICIDFSCLFFLVPFLPSFASHCLNWTRFL